jgi:hypothetical protein
MIARLDAKEPIYFLITWLGAHVGIGKLLLMSFVNGLLVFSLLSYLRLKKISFFIVFLILGNYYFWGVFLSAERLKFGVLFFIIGMIALEKNYKSWFVFFIISLLSHFQMLILIFCAVWTSFLDNIEKVRAAIYSQDVLTFTFISIILSCLSDVFLNLIYEKILFYHNHNGNTLFNVVKPMAFFFLAMFYTVPGKRLKMFFTFLPLILITYWLGSERVVMFVYFLFTYYLLELNKGLNFAIIITSGYFFVKGILFIVISIEYGNGFYFTRSLVKGISGRKKTS